MGNCNSCGAKESCNKEDNLSCEKSKNSQNRIKKVIGIMSGKGGVGKSSVTVLLATTLVKRGFKVGILDADITGPSIPRLLGLTGQKITSDGNYMLPVESKVGIKVVSLNLILEQEDSPVVWRGPIVTNTVIQFWQDVLWGDLDFLLVDMPPGTSDVALTVMQTIPVAGMVMVSIPQDMVAMIVAKAVNMTKKMGIKIFGIIENMSYLICPDCSKKIFLFGNNTAADYIKNLDVELLGQLPMDLSFSAFGAAGVEEKNSLIVKEFEKIIDKIKW